MSHPPRYSNHEVEPGEARSFKADPTERVELWAYSHGVGERVVYRGPRYYAEGLRHCFTIRWNQGTQLQVRPIYKTIEELFGVES